MADNKKSVLLYCDLIHTVEKLDNETAGELFKHYLRYINDLTPKTDNVIVDIVFEPIKQNLKRDLKKWEDTLGKRSDAGNKSAGKKAFDKWLKSMNVSEMNKEHHENELGYCLRKQREHYGTYMFYYYEYAISFHQQKITESTSVESVETESTKSTVIDTVIVNVTDTVKVIVKDIKTINSRKADFKKSLLAIVENSETPHYEMEMVKDFFEYWSEHGDNDRKMRYEKQTSYNISRRLATWFKRQNTFQKEKSSAEKETRVVGRQTLSTIEQNTKGWN